MKPLERDQLVFVVEYAMNAGLDTLDSALPDTITLVEYEQRKQEIGNYIAGAVRTVGMNLACLWAQTAGKVVGDGMGIGDALLASGYEALCDQFVSERTDPNWKGLNEGDKCHPDPRHLAEKFVDENWGDYLSPYSDEGYEQGDGCVIQFPEPMGGEIRCIDEHGNTLEVREYGDHDWLEWYLLFKDAPPHTRYFSGLKVLVIEDHGGLIMGHHCYVVEGGLDSCDLIVDQAGVHDDVHKNIPYEKIQPLFID